jgi:hypothetical protein
MAVLMLLAGSALLAATLARRGRDADPGDDAQTAIA